METEELNKEQEDFILEQSRDKTYDELEME